MKLVFKKTLKDGRHARLKISSYYLNEPHYAAISLVAHHHKRYVNDWTRKSDKSKRSQAIDKTDTGHGTEVFKWAAETIRQNLYLISKKYKYLLIEATDDRRFYVYAKLLIRHYNLKVYEHNYGDLVLLEIKIADLLQVRDAGLLQGTNT